MEKSVIFHQQEVIATLDGRMTEFRLTDSGK